MKMISFMFTAVGWASVASAHAGSLSQKPWKACKDVKLGDACEYKNHHGDTFKGVCRVVSENRICVRNQPIIKHETKKAEKKEPTKAE